MNISSFGFELAGPEPVGWVSYFDIRISCFRPRRRRNGFTLLEMLTTVAALVIVLGLMVSLARYVRNELAIEATRDLLHRLDTIVQQYMTRHGDKIPQVEPFIPPVTPADALPDEQTLQQRAVANNRGITEALRADGLLQDEAFGRLPESSFNPNEPGIRDAWGTPIVFMPSMHEGIGMALQDKPFFFSAGPDQRFLTQENNLYSYEK